MEGTGLSNLSIRIDTRNRFQRFEDEGTHFRISVYVSKLEIVFNWFENHKTVVEL